MLPVTIKSLSLANHCSESKEVVKVAVLAAMGLYWMRWVCSMEFAVVTTAPIK